AALDAADAGEVAVARDAAALAPGREGEDGLLLPPRDGALELDAPDLLLASAEPELAERDPQLDAPAVRRDGGPGLPHGVPGLVALVLLPAGEDLVAAHAGRVDHEAHGGEVVVVGVQRDREPVGVLHVGIAAAQPGGDA